MYLVQYKDDTSLSEYRVSYCEAETELNQMWSLDGSAITVTDVRNIGPARPFRIIIAGGRGFTDYVLLCNWMDYYLQNVNHEHVVVISGTASGADVLGERYARDRGMFIHQMPADWDRFKKQAGYMRNTDMAKEAGHDGACVVFWDMKSKGSGHMRDIAIRHSLMLRTVDYTKNQEAQYG